MNPTDLEEIETIAHVLSGQRQAFRLLMERHQDQVFRLCRLFLGDEMWAEDLTQEVFVTAFLQLGKYNADLGSFRTWLLTIARRQCCNAFRKRRENPAESNSEPETPETTRPDRAASRRELSQSIDQALLKLPMEHRNIFILAEIEELPHREIAQIENIPEGTVKSRLHRAKEALRSHLAVTYQEYIHQAP